MAVAMPYWLEWIKKQRCFVLLSVVVSSRATIEFEWYYENEREKGNVRIEEGDNITAVHRVFSVLLQ